MVWMCVLMVWIQMSVVYHKVVQQYVIFYDMYDSAMSVGGRMMMERQWKALGL